MKSAPILLLFASLALLTATSCNPKNTPLPPSNDTPSPNTYQEQQPQNPPYEPVIPPSGDPGPIAIQLQDHFPNHIFHSTANESHIILTYQSDIRDPAQCPASSPNFCFKAFATLAQRSNPTTLQTLEIYESDTQSQATIEATLARKEGFAILYKNGHYTGDIIQTNLLFIDNYGRKIAEFPLAPQNQNVQSANAIVLDDNNILACYYSIIHNEPVDYSNNTLNCSIFDTSGVAHSYPPLRVPKPIRNFALAEYKSKKLILLQTNGAIYTAFLESPSTILPLGEATTHRPSLAPGHSGFLASWISPKGILNAVRIELDGSHSEPLRIPELSYVPPTGNLVAIPQGFVLAANFENPTSIVALFEPDAKNWFTVDDVQTKYLIYGISALDIQNAHLGKFLWQTTASLIGTYSP